MSICLNRSHVDVSYLFPCYYATKQPLFKFVSRSKTNDFGNHLEKIAIILGFIIVFLCLRGGPSSSVSSSSQWSSSFLSFCSNLFVDIKFVIRDADPIELVGFER